MQQNEIRNWQANSERAFGLHDEEVERRGEYCVCTSRELMTQAINHVSLSIMNGAGHVSQAVCEALVEYVGQRPECPDRKLVVCPTCKRAIAVSSVIAGLSRLVCHLYEIESQELFDSLESNLHIAVTNAIRARHPHIVVAFSSGGNDAK